MKFIEILFSFLSNQGKFLLQSNTEAVTRQVINNARRIAGLLATTVISITLFCTGFSMAYSIWSPGLVAGIILALISIFGLIYSLGERRWLASVGINTDTIPATAKASLVDPTLQTAVAAILIELAAELKERRTQASSSTPQQSA
jgi:hypothetical protein